MKDTITAYQFSDAMIEQGFSYEGTKALFEYFEQYEQDCDMFGQISLKVHIIKKLLTNSIVLQKERLIV
jgi:hypothetical protein